MSSLGSATQTPPERVEPAAESEVDATVDVSDDSGADEITIALVSSEPGPRRRGRPPIDSEAPFGPERVREALIEAAAELFAARGVKSVSVRQVAAAAHVNPGLVYRYIGTKHDLVRAVLARFAEQLEDALRNAAIMPVSADTEATLDAHQRIIAHLLLEGYDLTTLRLDSPVVPRLVEMVQREAGDDVDVRVARMRSLQILALGMGWRLFGSYLLDVTGLGAEDRQDVHLAIRATNFAIGRGRVPLD